METLTPKRNSVPETESSLSDTAAAEQKYNELLNKPPEWKQEPYREAGDKLDAAEAASNEYRAGLIPQRLNRENALSIEPFSNAQLEHLYTLSKSSSLEEQRQYNDAIRHEPAQRMAQVAEYLASMDLQPEPGTDREEVGFSGTLTLPNEKEAAHLELTDGQLERLYELSMSHSRDKIEQFGQWLKTLSPEQEARFHAYKASRLQGKEENSKPAEVTADMTEDTPGPKFEEPLLPREGQRLLDYFQEVYMAAERGDRTDYMRASQAIDRMDKDSRFKYDLYVKQQNQLQGASIEKLEDVAALGRSVNPEEQAQYDKELPNLSAHDRDRLNKVRFNAIKTTPTYVVEEPPKQKWWRRVFGRKK